MEFFLNGFTKHYIKEKFIMAKIEDARNFSRKQDQPKKSDLSKKIQEPQRKKESGLGGKYSKI
jgi:hypothetical protein